MIIIFFSIIYFVIELFWSILATRYFETAWHGLRSLDKFDDTKPLSVEEMNKTTFERWTTEAHNEVTILLVECQ